MGKKDEGAGVDISPADKEANTGKDELPLVTFGTPRCWNRMQVGVKG